MSNDDFFTATDQWQAVQANGSDITNGTFSVFSLGSNIVHFFKSDTLPLQTVDEGPARFSSPESPLKYPLTASEKLFCKTAVSGSTVKIGVIPS